MVRLQHLEPYLNAGSRLGTRSLGTQLVRLFRPDRKTSTTVRWFRCHHYHLPV